MKKTLQDNSVDNLPNSDIGSSRRIFINVSGLQFETRTDTLNRYPNTLLGNRKKRMKYHGNNVGKQTNEFFFNRHRESFSSILFFYQSFGKLCRPCNVDLKVFIDECEFFQLPEWAIYSMKRKEGGFMEDEIFDALNSKAIEGEISFRCKVWNFLEDPSSSKHARRFVYFYVCLLFVSIVINCLKTVKELRYSGGHFHDGWEKADIAINIYFLIEFMVRFIISPSKKEFVNSILSWIDFIALVTFIPMINNHYEHGSVVLLFTPFQLVRVVRLFRLAKFIPGLNVTEVIVKNSVSDIHNFVSCLMILVTFGGTIMFFIERNEHGTTFTSVPKSMYWALQTFATVGYGDMVPTSVWGKVFASFFIVCFIPTISVPTLSIIINFSRFYEVYKAIKG